MSYNLFLDDQRLPKDVSWITNFPVNVEWVIAKNYDEFCQILIERGIPKIISFDHDLHKEHYPWSTQTEESYEKGFIPYEKYREKTGKECLEFSLEYLSNFRETIHPQEVDDPQIFIHTMNVIGRNNMYDLLKNFGLIDFDVIKVGEENSFDNDY